MKLLSKFILWTISILILGCLSLVAIIIIGTSVKSYFYKVPFDSTQWKASTDSSNKVKQRMLPDLLKKHKLMGLKVEEINQLLGKPPNSNYFKDYDYVYWLGPERGMGVDSEWLGIKFSNGVVEKVDILQD